MCQFMSGAENNFFKKIVYVMVEAVIWDINHNLDKRIVKDAAAFLCMVHKSMQPLYRFGLVILAVAFSIRRGRGFLELTPEQHMQLMRKWLKSPIGVKRDFIRFFLNMTLLFYYDSADTLHSLGVDTKSHRKIQCFYAR
ncbi:MAG: hypothetical protein HYT98_01355 [Candidatus Sungbacteria bacterium]|nr:hypothetical protein [Candidatus Sungbacteria bacterium]